MNNCIFCNRAKIKEEILWESENFFVKVGVSILTPGHIMIISKDHISCFAELPSKLDKKFLLIKNIVSNKIQKSFSEPIIYEHGVYSQSVFHAHIHLIPSKSKYYNSTNLKEKIFKELKSTKIKNIFQIKEIYKKEGSYIYLEQDGYKCIFHTKGFPNKKFDFRKEYVRLTGLEGLSSWENMSEKDKKRDKEWVEITKKKLKFNYTS